ncbi:MAG TPA: FG-GAP-like repeat-containing protein [Pirellulales bacterium]|nr:FG-GAP-like repeat-containing protein [Pirellulales bacterium]
MLAILVVTVGWRLWQRAHSPARLLEQARQASEANDYARAEALCRQIGDDSPESSAAMLLAGQVALKQDRLLDAMAYFDRIPSEAGQDAVTGRCTVAEIWRRLGHASEAEAQYLAALDIDPMNAVVHDGLATLLTVEGRRFESLPHVYELLRQRHHSCELLLLAGEHSKAVEAADVLAHFRAAAPDDPAPLIGLARIELRQQNRAQAVAMLRQVIAEAPQLVEAHALLGRALLDDGGDDELAVWQSGLPPESDWHPDIWAVYGGWAKRRGQNEAAARCLWEALRRDANHSSATLQLSQLLDTLGETALARDLAVRAAALADFALLLERLFQHRDDASLLLAAARQTEILGRLWEAWGWNRLALAADGDADGARDALARIEPQLNDSLPPTLPSIDPGVRLDLSHYPLPESDGSSDDAVKAPVGLTDASPRFRELAREVGIDFTYFCGREGTNPRARMFESLGGGIAVLDYDLDGWPDLYFTQGCRWPPRAGQTEYLDVLYRNLGGQSFADVTSASGLGDDRFSQGATVGDFDGDGFADVYVANIGVNRLYHNQGDGTFNEVGEAAGIRDDHWTTSCLLADVNGDGLPDLYDVNYLQGPGVFERTCQVNGEPRTCRPGTFEPAPDAFYLNLGDGRFQEMTAEAGLVGSGGNGLGIVAADFDRTGRLNLFVANDQDANFYFVNRTTAAAARPMFEERGLLSGLAFDGDGRALASMGVAAGDANGDGRLDLLVTNFSQESSTVYLRDSGDSFTDATGPSGLREPSYPMLGFGAQFLDGESDGLDDLVVTNGHIHEFSAPGVSYAMRPQYFRNRGDGRFEELSADTLGAYFGQTCFGRGLARLDFNRDGHDDFAVSAIETPAALVSNQTPAAGHFLSVQLRGVRSSRDAIGAVVTVRVGRREQTKWLNAGDGYHASNQRQLVFGLGRARRVDRLSLFWPSGLVQEFTDLEGDREWIFVEGTPRPSPLPP